MRQSKNIFLSFLIFLFKISFSQNLVKNPSFEKYHILPCDVITGKMFFDEVFYDWTNPEETWTEPTDGTSDIFSTLVSDSCYGSCQSVYTSQWLNGKGWQLPRTGNVMAGFYMGGNNYREYVQSTLTTPLQIGKTYIGEMYVSLADSCGYAVNNLGMYFSSSKIDLPGDKAMTFITPQVNETKVIRDKEKWVKISEVFIAIDSAKYVIVGGFYDDVHSKQEWNFPFGEIGPYYFVDDVSVREVNEIIGDSLICLGDSTVLTAYNSASYKWVVSTDPTTIISTDSSITISPAASKKYLVYRDNDTLSFQVTVKKTVHPTINLGNDTTMCKGKTMTLNIPDTSYSYVWQDGLISPSYTVSDEGKYKVQSIFENCKASSIVKDTVADSIYVSYFWPPDIYLGNDTILCNGDILELRPFSNPGNGLTTFEWTLS